MSDMKRFLVEFELESHSCLIGGLDEQRVISATDGVEYLVSNLSTEIGNEHPLLCLRILFDAPDFGLAEEIGNEKAKRFVRCLSFAASTPCQVHRMTRIVDWTTGLQERGALIVTSHRGHDLPYKVIDPELLRTVQGLVSLNIGEEIYQSMKWHYYGILSQYTDEQFQNFWLSLETLIQVGGNTAKVTDLCSKCRSPLFCENCGTHPTHRPYPKQKVESLFTEIEPKVGQQIFDDASRVRNIISHGHDVSAFVQEAGIDFHQLVDTLGQMSFKGILIALQKSSCLKQEEMKYLFHLVSTFIKQTLISRAEILFSSKDPNAPNISDVPDVKATLIFGEKD